jgi:DNA polymerase I-like protein with 3'-5' exonuclease and polymerase domains
MYNNPCQGTGADLLKLVLCELYDRLSASDARITCCIHDEIILEVPAEYAKIYSDMLSTIMVRVGSELLHPVPVKANVKILASWAEE